MEVKNAVHPTPEQMAGYAEPGADGAIYMLNLLKFRDRAEYADGRETELSGAEAYAVYGVGVMKLLPEFGGYLAFSAPVERLMLGEVEELWDSMAIAMYPSRQAMLDMMQSHEYQAIHVHREAGLAGQLNIEGVGAVGKWLAGA
ncbi:DUF1330 domain-containing protein [Congregibacter sp.]|uniref:DUF1330 domain-containing protein n=1 Tax=Congregibacter sp. TaxID=2744308 RepID=UPI003F6A671E